ncbi:PREDICTED: mitogen-activated protein kinase kinase kinase NPK1-like isoform X2 [Nelumbo nucifera]|uniref:mitogen-activated protein kinase kinase kinase n=1 Tax=Nelumbo nucifera TaxID=4432 RepID=A0A1U8AV80_NELNU|nr:PREDICTED: mitogen-activated protein kinase kinase kinase NPK1-like isoform X2 [Nelumbo nucifera]
MSDIFGSVRRSFVLRRSTSNSSSSIKDEGGEGGIVEKIGSYLRKSREEIISKLQKPPMLAMENEPPIRWRKGELIGCGAYGRVYMGMNLDSGELLAVKQVSIIKRNTPREKTQAHILELEEEVKLLKNLSHPNIVRYLGTAREEESLNIFLEFVPGGSISSLLGKFGSFPEPVIRMYTKQLLKGLEYLHRNGIIHRDIKGANILVDNKGCIKLADFGASKKVVELANMLSTKSMKGTPYWMAPEVILQTGHTFSADIWSVGCTVIEMATGKPPWSEQYQEVAALFHVGMTKSHPPIPEHLSLEAKDFLLKCLQKEPELRLSASDLLQHSFIREEYRDSHSIYVSPSKEHSQALIFSSAVDSKNLTPGVVAKPRATYQGFRAGCNIHNVRCPTSEANKDEKMCQTSTDNGFKAEKKLRTDSSLTQDSFYKDWKCKSKESSEPRGLNLEDCCGSDYSTVSSYEAHAKREDGIIFPLQMPLHGGGDDDDDDDDEVTASKIRACLDDMALDLKKLQTPLYEEFYNLESGCKHIVANDKDDREGSRISSTPLSKLASGTLSSLADAERTGSLGSCGTCISSNRSSTTDQVLREIPPSQLNEWEGTLLESQLEPNSPSGSCSERQRKWKEELDQELERHRGMMRQVGLSRKSSSSRDRGLKRRRDRSWDVSPSK